MCTNQGADLAKIIDMVMINCIIFSFQKMAFLTASQIVSTLHDLHEIHKDFRTTLDKKIKDGALQMSEETHLKDLAIKASDTAQGSCHFHGLTFIL